MLLMSLSEKNLHFVTHLGWNNNRAFTCHVVLCYSDGIDKILSAMTADEYFHNFLMEHQSSVKIVPIDIVPGTEQEFHILLERKAKSNEKLFNCWIFCDLHQIQSTTIRKIEIGKIKNALIVFGQNGIKLLPQA